MSAPTNSRLKSQIVGVRISGFLLALDLSTKSLILVFRANPCPTDQKMKREARERAHKSRIFLSPATVSKRAEEIIVISSIGKINGPSRRVMNVEYLSASNHLLTIDLFPAIPNSMYDVIAEVKIIAAYPGSLLTVEIKAKRPPVPQINRKM